MAIPVVVPPLVRGRRLLVDGSLAGVGLFEWHQIDRAVESGRAAAREALERAPGSVFG